MKVLSAFIISIIGAVITGFIFTHLATPLGFIIFVLLGCFYLFANAPGLMLLLSIICVVACAPLGFVFLILLLCAGAGK